MKKKLFALILALCMVISLIPITALAADSGTSTENTETTTLLPDADDDGVITLTGNVTLSETYEVSTTVTLDLAGHTLTAPSEHSAISVESGGNLTVKDTGTNGKIVGFHNVIDVAGGTLTLTGGTLTIDDSVTDLALATGVYVSKNGTVNVQDDATIDVKGTALSGNNTTPISNFYISGGTIKSGVGPAIYKPDIGTVKISGGELYGGLLLRMGDVTISGGKIINNVTGNTDALSVEYGSQCIWFSNAITVYSGCSAYTSKVDGDNGDLKLTISGGEFSTSVAATESGVSDKEKGGDGLAVYVAGGRQQNINIDITGGAFSSNSNVTGSKAVAVYNVEDLGVTATNYQNKKTDGTQVNTANVSISGGYFTSDPSEYVAEDKAAVPSDKGGYTYMVGDAADADVQPAVGETAVTVPDSFTEEERAVVQAAAESVEADAGILAAAANTVLDEITEAQTEQAEADIKADDSGVTVNSGDTVTIYAQTYLQVTPTAYDATGKTLTLDIQPMYRVVASTATTADGIVVVGEATSGENKTPNAVVLADSEKELTGITTITISLQLPSGFVDDENSTVYVQHKGYEYTATVTKNSDDENIATFTNPHGFSEFVISAASAAIAKIGDVSYTSLQAAVDAVQNGQTITVLEDGATATVNRTVSFTVDKATEVSSYTITLGSYCTNKSSAADKYDVVYSAPAVIPSTGGATTYSVTVFKAADGTVTASPSSAAEGSTVTLTVTPDEGYELDSLTVTDAGGNALALIRVSGTTYTFTMPAGAVTVRAAFKEAACPSERFVDVDLNGWYHESVDYVVAHGIMNGTGADTFDPNGTLTRGMMAQVLYNLEGAPANAGLVSFTDVGDGLWYTAAVNWAASVGVITGYEDGSFRPERNITRQEMAAMLYRYANYKGCDMTASGALEQFTDGGSAAAWAADALKWAVGSGLLNGRENNTLAPAGTATRAEVATILMRFHKTLN